MQAKAALPSPAPAMTTMTTPAAAPARHRAVLGQLSDMDLRLLQVFKSVVECGGVAGARPERKKRTHPHPPNERPGTPARPDAVPPWAGRFCAHRRRPAGV